MKKLFLLSTVLFTLALCFGCKKEQFNDQTRYKKSLAAWQSFKKEAANSYQYTTSGGSWVGMSWETTLTVKDGIVTQRTFKYHLPEDWDRGEIPEEEKEWTEIGEEVGTHEGSSASQPITLDEVYQKAKEVWLVKRKNTTTTFETNNGGIISICGYSENNCVDDCFIGINITSIVPLSTE